MIRYSYLWAREAREGREEGLEDRPCAIVLVVLRDGDAPLVRVLPVTHSPPATPADALEIPQAVKQRLGLDSDRSWVVLTEANDFVWPGPDLRPALPGDLSSAAYGFLPPGFFRVLRDRITEQYRLKRLRALPRSE
ncbi:hypothetical protein CH341_05500 [Rhodoplanes roseus]|uniref:Growth inhibitor PemK n=1 Tax=Rhodoplanes roseus TaxID=29409 RepID=A0A327L5K4_9BRAD|nr:hypothetical protein CH341_05500 [Rhodoplanes roseus]